MNVEKAGSPEPLPEFFPRPETLPRPEPELLLTLRVSRDGGRTWETRREIHSTDPLAPLMTSMWPPCQCPRHREP